MATPGLLLEDAKQHEFLNYLSYKQSLRDKAIFDELWLAECERHNLITDQINGWLSQPNPSTGVRLLLGRDDFIGQHKGEAIEVAVCTQIVPKRIIFSHMIDGECYRWTPVVLEDYPRRRIMHIVPGSRDLVKDSDKINCSEVNKYQPLTYTDGIWSNAKGPLKSLSRKVELPQPNIANPTLFNAPSIYGSILQGINAEMDLIGTAVHTMGSSQFDVTAQRASNAPSVEEAIAQIFKEGQESVQAAGEIAKGWWTSTWQALGHWIDAWKWWVFLTLVAVIVIVVGIFALLCCGPALLSNFFNRNRPHPPLMINALQHVPLMPMAPPLPYEEDDIHRPLPKNPFFVSAYHVEVDAVNAEGSDEEEDPLGRTVEVTLKINGHEVVSLYDPGANKSFLRASVLDRLNIPSHPIHKVARAANGTTLPFTRRTESVNVQVGNTTVPFRLWAADDQHCPRDLLMGTDLLHKLLPSGEVAMNLEEGYIRFGTGPQIPFVCSVQVSPLYARLEEDALLEGRSDNVVMAYLQDPTVIKYHQLALAEPFHHRYDTVAVGKIVFSPKNGRFPLRVMNTSSVPVKLYKHSRLAIVEPIDKPIIPVAFKDPEMEEEGQVAAVKVDEAHPSMQDKDQAESKGLHASPVKETQLDPIVEKINLKDSILTTQGKHRLLQLISKYSAAFVGADGRIGNYSGPIRHRIDLIPGAIPYKARPYRMSPAMQEEVKKQIDNLLAQGIIRPSTSEWAAPLVMVTKKDGGVRMAVDYRRLNAVTRKEAYLLPLIPELLDQAAGSSYYSVMDLASGFHQISLHPAHCQRTAFVTQWAQYEYTRVPFGLAGAPSTFQRAMGDLRRHLSSSLICYLDDVILCASTEEAHLCDLEEYFKAIILLGLKMKPSKCAFALKEIRYLGVLVSGKGVRVDPANFSTISNFTRPHTLKELRSLLGALSFWRKFVPNFARLAHPLTQLTKKDALHEWREEHQQALETLKRCLLSSPVLAPPRMKDPFVIETDASAVGLGAVLLQKELNGEAEHPISYISRATTKAEKSYHSLESEALCVGWALKTFRCYVEGKRTLVRTDNNGVCSLLKRKSLEGRLLRFQLLIQNYDVIFEHRKGSTNTFCDHLSRYAFKRENESSTDAAADASSDPKEGSPPSIDHKQILHSKESFSPCSHASPTPGESAEATHPHFTTIGGHSPLPYSDSPLKDNDQDKDPFRINSTNVPSTEGGRPVVGREDIKAAQQLEFPQLYAALANGEWPEEDDARQKLERRAEEFTCSGGLLYKQDRVLVPSTLRERITNDVHTSPMDGAHLGSERTLATLAAHAYWPSMKEDVKLLIQACELCQQRKSPPELLGCAPLHPIKKPTIPSDHWHLDLMGPLPRTEEGFRYIMVAVDAMSKWTTATPLRDISAITVTRCFVSEIIYQWGSPRTVSTDQGTQFTSSLFGELSSWGIHHVMSVPHHSQGNGQVERVNRVIGDMIASYVSEEGEDWDVYLPATVFALNCSIHSTSNHSPFYLSHGWRPRTPFSARVEPLEPPSPLTEFGFQRQLAKMQEAWRVTSTLIRQRQEVERKHFNRKNNVRIKSFAIGDLVMLRLYARPHKFAMRWTGPFVVLTVEAPNLTLDKGGSPYKAHFNQVKIYRTPPSFSQQRRRGQSISATAGGGSSQGNGENVTRPINNPSNTPPPISTNGEGAAPVNTTATGRWIRSGGRLHPNF